MTYRQPFKNDYPITQYYGETVTSKFHTGIDYALPMNTPVLASADGVVRYCGYDTTGYGYCVILEHDLTHSTLYAHLNKLEPLFASYHVKQGALLGYSGSSGNSTGPHLHFEARKTWNDYRTHFDPMFLPLMTMIDTPMPSEPSISLKTYSELSDRVKVVAPLGAYGHLKDFSAKQIITPGTELIFTGNTTVRNGLVFCECCPVASPVWVAVNDGETQILDNAEN